MHAACLACQITSLSGFELGRVQMVTAVLFVPAVVASEVVVCDCFAGLVPLCENVGLFEQLKHHAKVLCKAKVE